MWKSSFSHSTIIQTLLFIHTKSVLSFQQHLMERCKNSAYISFFCFIFECWSQFLSLLLNNMKSDKFSDRQWRFVLLLTRTNAADALPVATKHTVFVCEQLKCCFILLSVIYTDFFHCQSTHNISSVFSLSFIESSLSLISIYIKPNYAF